MEDENMDVDVDTEEDIFAGIELPYEETASEYEISDEEVTKKQTEKVKATSKKGSSSQEAERKSGSQRAAKLPGSEKATGSKKEAGSRKGAAPKRKKDVVRREEEIDSPSVDQNARNQVQQQNTDSVNLSANSIKLPLREFAKKNLKRKDSPVQIEGDEPRKRWKKTPNPKYLSLLNTDITDTIARGIPDTTKLEGSQIGSSIWTASEKDTFFNALSRIGRDNVKAISARIGTKSELEVQEYIQILHAEYINRRIDSRLLEFPDFPAALEISEECSEGLEAAADRISDLQERSEIEVEREKWGDSWLLTPETSRWLNKRRDQDGGKDAIDEVLPAANLFKLEKWLELSDRIFMNYWDSEDNWNNLGDEAPSIRATAFEDFHSLAVFITKKILSTALYSAMSRLRAIQAQKVKHAEVTPADIEAAVNILKLDHNSDDFWKKAARRCNLQVVGEDDTTIISYADVEADLSSMPHNRRSRSRSASRPRTDIPSEEEALAGDDESADSSLFEDEDEDEDEDEEEEEDEDEEGASLSDTERIETARDREEREEAMEAYTELLDQKTSREEEATLWKMIGRVPTKKSTDEEEEVLVKPRRLLNVYEEQLGWRDHVKYRSEWEVMNGMVGEEEFERNRNRVAKCRRGSRGRSAARDRALRGGLSSELVGDDEEDSPAEDDEKRGKGEDDALEARSVQVDENSDQGELLGSVEEDEEAESVGKERSVRNDHEDDDEDMEEEVRRSEPPEDDGIMDAASQRAEEGEEENYEDEEDD